MNKINAIRRLVMSDPMELIWPVLAFVATFAAGWLLRRLFLRALRAWNERTGGRPGLILAESLRGATWMWIVILAAHFAVQSSDLSQSIRDTVATGLLDVWVLSLTLMSMRIARELVRHYGGQMPGALPVTTLTQNLAQIGVLILGILVVLGPSITRLTPILTALGVGGLAVALALQDTLSNLFGGFYVAVAGQVRLGDYIKLNTGEEGYVTDIGWRSTTIKGLNNNLIIVPNAKLAQAIVTNYYLPEKSMAVSVQVAAGRDSDPDKIEKLLLEVAASGAGEIPGMLAEPAPSVAFDPGFGEFGLAFTVNYQVAEFASQFGVRNELRKRIFRRFREEGVEIPFPARAVYLHAPAAAAPASAAPSEGANRGTSEAHP
jgi:small-conductance mechanosensitive channel